MNWLADNWIWIVLVFGMFAMHVFGHRGHDHGFAGKSGHHHSGGADGSSADPAVSSTGEPTGKGDPQSPPAQRHRHGC